MWYPLCCPKLVYGKKMALLHRNMLYDSYLSAVNKIKIIIFWSSVDVSLKESYEQISEFFCFTAICLSVKTLSYLLVPREIQSRIFCSHPSEYDSLYVDNLEYSLCLSPLAYKDVTNTLPSGKSRIAARIPTGLKLVSVSAPQ